MGPRQKKAIMRIIPLAVEAATGKNLPFEISETLYDMIFSTKDWISHQMGNGSRNEGEFLFLSSTNESGQVSADDIGGRQPGAAQNLWDEDQDTMDTRSESETHLISRSSSTMAETDFMDIVSDSADSARSGSTPRSEYGEFEINSESLDLFFKTEIVI